MSTNPTMMQAAARARMSDLQQAALERSWHLRRRGHRNGSGVRRTSPVAGTGEGPTIRRAIGWSLVSVGLHLALHQERPRPIR